MTFALRGKWSGSALLVSFLLFAAPVRAAGFASEVHLVPDVTVEAQPSRTPDAFRIGGELGGGMLGEAALVIPGMYAGVLLAQTLHDWSCRQGTPCSDLDADRISRVITGASIGGSLGMGLGSGLGVAISGALLHAGGNPWLAVGGGLAGGALGLLLPAPQPVGLAASAAFGMIGSTLAYELSRSGSGATFALPGAARSDLRFTPTVMVGPGGGQLGVTGQF